MLALHALKAGDNISDGIVTDMPHVEIPARVGEHREAIKLLFAGVFEGFETGVGVPIFLSRGLHGGRIVGVTVVTHSGLGSPSTERHGEARQEAH